MSIKIMNAVWEHAPYEGNTLLTLLALADRADDEGVCWPSVETLTKKTRQSERNTQRCLLRLAADGVIDRSFRKDKSTMYRVLVGKFLDKMSPLGKTPGDVAGIDGVTNTTNGMSQMSPNTSIKHSSIDSSDLPSPKKAGKVDQRRVGFIEDLKTYWEAVNKKVPLPFQPSGKDFKNLDIFLKDHPKTDRETFRFALNERRKAKANPAEDIHRWICRILEYVEGKTNGHGNSRTAGNTGAAHEFLTTAGHQILAPGGRIIQPSNLRQLTGDLGGHLDKGKTG